MNIQSRVTPLFHFYFDFVTKIQPSKITLNKSKDHSNFEKFTLWILIKYMNIHSRIKPSSLLYVCDKDSIQLLVSEATPIRGHTPSGPLLPLLRPSSIVGVTPPRPYDAMPLNATPHVFFCTLLDFSKLKLFFFHYC